MPKSREAIARIQSERKRVAVQRAMRAPYFEGKLEHVDLDRLDDPEEWGKIPVLEKDALRAMSDTQFYEEFCYAPAAEVAEFWRSGGTTGKPLFYPRTHEDIAYAMVGFRRNFECMACKPGDIAHNSFPMGIHPVGHMLSRAGEQAGVGIAWVGAGSAVPSKMQLELIDKLKPTVWMGMSSYGLHLANLAEASGSDLATGTVKKIHCSAEPVSSAKREKLERTWGARVFDSFGMTECGMMAAEAGVPGMLHMWTDFAFIEVVDPDTFTPVPEGEPGILLVTSLWTNNATPFLRWNSGDIVTYHSDAGSGGPFDVFPCIRHAHRTAGFFKVRGVNIGHQEFEDFMFRHGDVNDFKAEAIDTGGLDALRVCIEVRRGADPEWVSATLADDVKSTFEITPEIMVLELGSLAHEFEGSVKAPRFIDRR